MVRYQKVGYEELSLLRRCIAKNDCNERTGGETLTEDVFNLTHQTLMMFPVNRIISTHIQKRVTPYDDRSAELRAF